MAKNFKDLTEREILALAIALEEEDGRVYGEFAQRLGESYPGTARVLSEMQAEESEHRTSLLNLYRSRFGDHLPFIRRQDVQGFVPRPAIWLASSVGPAAVRRAMESMEEETRRFYLEAMRQVKDVSTRQLLGDLANAELKHSAHSKTMEEQHVSGSMQQAESDTERRNFVLQYVQPALAGLMDGSVSTLAPLFAAAFATHLSNDAFRVGLAASIGAGISMAFAEALSDDGSLTGRGSPVVRGSVTGLMTTVGGIGHTLPYMIADFQVATGVAVGVVIVELAAISWIRKKYMDTSLVRAAMQVAFGGALVFAAGILIGSS